MRGCEHAEAENKRLTDDLAFERKMVERFGRFEQCERDGRTITAGEEYRCFDCAKPFHRECAKTHGKEEIGALREENKRLTEELAWANVPDLTLRSRLSALEKVLRGGDAQTRATGGEEVSDDIIRAARVLAEGWRQFRGGSGDVCPDLYREDHDSEHCRRCAMDRAAQHYDAHDPPVPPQTPNPQTCGSAIGSKPTWMSEGQYDPCRCHLLKGHAGGHECGHISQTPDPQTTQPKCAVCGQPMLMTETLIFGGGLNPTHHKRCGGQTPNPQTGEVK